MLLDKAKSTVTPEAVERIAPSYLMKRELAEHTPDKRLALRDNATRSPWWEMHTRLESERQHLPDGCPAAKALDYSA